MKKQKYITFLIILIGTGLIYSIFLTGYFSIDTEKIVGQGYDWYATNYSFYDGRPVMGAICMIANIFKVPIKVFYITLLVMAILVSSITVIKMIKIVENKRTSKNKLQYILLGIIAYNYIFNFMTIDNMQWAECFIMALSIWFYIISVENLIIKQNYKKALLYCTVGMFCYQGTINMLFITAILFYFLENNKVNKETIKTIVSLSTIVIIAALLNIVFVKFAHYNINSEQPDRIDANILRNIISNLKELPYLLFNSIDLFPYGLYLIFIIVTLGISYIYAIKNDNTKQFIIAILLFFGSVLCSLFLLLIYYKGIDNGNGRCFGSIGASFSVIWLYLYVHTDILDTKNYVQYITYFIILTYFFVNIYNILSYTGYYKQGNIIDEELVRKIEQKISTYEKEGNEIKYIAIKYIQKNNQNETKSPVLKSKKLTALFNEDTIKVYTNGRINLERTYFDEEIEEKTIKCIGDTIYVAY